MIKELIKDTLKYPTRFISKVEELEEYKDTLDELILLHRSKLEVSQALFCSISLLDEFAQLYFHCSYEQYESTLVSRSNTMLINSQYEMALQGNAKMSIFLGKNYAGQVEDTTSLIQMRADNVNIIDDFTLANENIDNDDITKEG